MNIAEELKPLFPSLWNVKNHPYCKTHAETKIFKPQPNFKLHGSEGGCNFSNDTYQPLAYPFTPTSYPLPECSLVHREDLCELAEGTSSLHGVSSSVSLEGISSYSYGG